MSLEEISDLLFARFVDSSSTQLAHDGSVVLVVYDKERKNGNVVPTSLESDESLSTRHGPIWGTERCSLATHV